MKKKQITLFFLLLTVATCNNLKASFAKNPRGPFVKKSEYKKALSAWHDAVNATEKHENELEELKKKQEDTTACQEELGAKKLEAATLEKDLVGCSEERNDLKDRNSDLERQIVNIRKASNNSIDAFQQERDRFQDDANRSRDEVKQWESKEDTWKTERASLDNRLNNSSADSKTFNRCKPYLGGLGVAGGAEALLYYTKGENKYLKLLHSATKDSRKLQMVSTLAAAHDDSHTFLNGYSAQGIDAEGGMFKVPGKNVASEIASSVGLRWVWNRFFADRIKSSNNFFVRNARKLPKPIKKFSQDVTRLAMVRTCALALRGENPFEKMRGPSSGRR